MNFTSIKIAFKFINFCRNNSPHSFHIVHYCACRALSNAAVVKSFNSFKTDTYRPFIFPAQLSQIGSLNSDCVLTPFRNHSLKLGPSTHFSLLRVPCALLRNIELMSASKYTFRSLYFDSVCTGGKTTATPSFLCSHRLRACI